MRKSNRRKFTAEHWVFCGEARWIGDVEARKRNWKIRGGGKVVLRWGSKREIEGGVGRNFLGRGFFYEGYRVIDG
jgi:hypothetical protein